MADYTQIPNPELIQWLRGNIREYGKQNKRRKKRKTKPKVIRM